VTHTYKASHRSALLLFFVTLARSVDKQRVAVLCTWLKCTTASCSALQCCAVYCSVLHCAAACCSMLQCVAPHCRVLHRVEMCYPRASALPRLVLQRTATREKYSATHAPTYFKTLLHTTTHCNTLQHTTTHSNGGVLRLVPPHNTLQHPKNTLEHNTLQHEKKSATQHTATREKHSATHAPTHVKTLQHTTPIPQI